MTAYYSIATLPLPHFGVRGPGGGGGPLPAIALRRHPGGADPALCAVIIHPEPLRRPFQRRQPDIVRQPARVDIAPGIHKWKQVPARRRPEVDDGARGDHAVAQAGRGRFLNRRRLYRWRLERRRSRPLHQHDGACAVGGGTGPAILRVSLKRTSPSADWWRRPTIAMSPSPGSRPRRLARHSRRHPPRPGSRNPAPSDRRCRPRPGGGIVRRWPGHKSRYRRKPAASNSAQSKRSRALQSGWRPIAFASALPLLLRAGTDTIHKRRHARSGRRRERDGRELTLVDIKSRFRSLEVGALRWHWRHYLAGLPARSG